MHACVRVRELPHVRLHVLRRFAVSVHIFCGKVRASNRVGLPSVGFFD